MKKTFKPDHEFLSKLGLRFGKNQISFRVRVRANKQYVISARIFLYDNSKPRKVKFLQ